MGDIGLYAFLSFTASRQNTDETTAFIYVIFPRLNFIAGLLISACLTPTDPIISAAIVGASCPYSQLPHLQNASCIQLTCGAGGKFAVKHVPLNLRRLIAAESASNDGMAYPFLTIAIYVLTEANAGVAIEKWIVLGWLCKHLCPTSCVRH